VGKDEEMGTKEGVKKKRKEERLEAMNKNSIPYAPDLEKERKRDTQQMRGKYRTR